MAVRVSRSLLFSLLLKLKSCDVLHVEWFLTSAEYVVVAGLGDVNLRLPHRRRLLCVRFFTGTLSHIDCVANSSS